MKKEKLDPLKQITNIKTGTKPMSNTISIRVETPEEKAKRLGVPLIHERPVKIEPPSEKDHDFKDILHEEMTRYQNEVVSVCTCGKTIRRKMDDVPCGNQGCPFGYLTN